MKRAKLRVDGVLLLDKPRGMTSNAALQAARRLFSAARAGHTGTLDPLATGLLPLCFGEATKFASDLLDADKTYEAEICFGVSTTTGDAEGEIVERRTPVFERRQLEAALEKFRGRIAQIPPMYSALKRDGQALYKLARQGVTVEREAREVVIAELLLLDYSAGRCRLRVSCGKGTYIRTLAEDIGRALDCGAHLTALRRVAVGNVSIARAVTLDALAVLPENERPRALLPPDALLQNLPEIRLDEAQKERFMHGNPVAAAGAIQGRCRVYAESGLLGVGHADASGIVRPQRLVAFCDETALGSRTPCD
ncbi:MAG: tRNA pseudouridine(55) synthase TruB [Candidatus Accumulibacter sp.]|jgi:tRNA pseudouridine55 synthase|nr:tRNA pseudouridine(55) synthase TruB [Accumulibacter sp.]